MIVYLFSPNLYDSFAAIPLVVSRFRNDTCLPFGTEMTEEKKLFKLIKSLTDEQCKAVELALDGMLSKNLPTLFRRMKVLEKWDQNSRSSIKSGGRFTNRGKYHTYCKELRRGIIGILCQPSEFGFDLSYIQKAVELDMLELAIEKAWESIQDALKANDRRRLLLVLAKVQDLELEYRISFSFPGEVPNINDLRERFDQELKLGSLLVQVKKAFKEDFRSRQFAAQRIAGRLGEIMPVSRKSQFRKQKAVIGTHLLNRDFESAVALQQQLVDWMFADREFFRFAELVYEVTSLVNLGMGIKDKGLVAKYYISLSTFVPQTKYEESVLFQIVGRCLVSVGEFLPSMDALESSERYINEKDLNPSQFAVSSFFQALGYFYFDQVDLALSKMSLIRTLSGKDCKQINWESTLLAAICHWEKGGTNVVYSLLNSAETLAKKADNQYQMVATRIIKELFSEDSWENSLSHHEALEELLNDPNELMAARCFDLRYLLLSKGNTTPLSEIVRNAQRKSHLAEMQLGTA